MKFKSSTFLLSVAVVSLAIGWTVDRTSRMAKHKKELERVMVSQRFGERIWASYQADVAYFDVPSNKLESHFKTSMVVNVLELWENEDEYNSSSMSKMYSSEELAKQMLFSLDCLKIEDFRTLTGSLYRFQLESDRPNVPTIRSGPNSQPSQMERFPELHLETSESYLALDDFLKRALNSQ